MQVGEAQSLGKRPVARAARGFDSLALLRLGEVTS